MAKKNTCVGFMNLYQILRHIKKKHFTSFHNLAKWQVHLLYICNLGKDDFFPFCGIFFECYNLLKRTFGKKTF